MAPPDGPACRVAVVTGAGRGLGRTIATSLGARGVDVAVLSRTRPELEETATLVESAGARALALAVDLTVWDDVRAAFDRIHAELGPVDLLVNNAGACRAMGPSWDLDPQLWWGDISANLLTTYLCSRAALSQMTPRRKGRIVNLGSESGVAAPDPAVARGLAGGHSVAMTAYGTAKAAVHQFTAQLALELAPFGITVVAIRPGPVRSSMTDAIAERMEVPPESWLPWADEGQGAAELVWRLARGEGDALSGRYLRSAEELGAHGA